ncbi:MAG: hypothetical protein OES79_04795, partial [Planctomycetota bacterium]|nr:hypothetical protein [Planctomycetota bacterium]
PVQTLTFGEGEDVTSIVFFAVDAATATSDPSDISTPRPLTVPPASVTPNSPIGLGEPDLTEAELQALSAMVNIDGTGVDGTGEFPFIRDEIAMNVSTSGIGVNNNVLQGEDLPTDDPGTINSFDSGAFDESFVINPEPLASEVKVFISKTAGGFLPPNADGSLQGTPAKTDYLYYNVYDELGNFTDAILVTSNIVNDEADVADGGTGENLWSFSVDIDDIKDSNSEITGDSIDAIQFTMGFGAIKIPKIEVVVEGDAPPNDIFLDFSATLTDADGDSASTSFAIDLFANDVISDTQVFDYTLVDAGLGADAFNANASGTEGTYLVQGFVVEEDTLVLLNLADGYNDPVYGDFDGDGDDNDTLITSNAGLTVIVEDATLTTDDISDGLNFLAAEEPAEDDGLVMLLV